MSDEANGFDIDRDRDNLSHHCGFGWYSLGGDGTCKREGEASGVHE